MAAWPGKANCEKCEGKMSEKVVEAKLPSDGGATVEDADMTQIETAAAREDKRSFVELIRAVKWQERTAPQLLRAIDLAFGLEIHSFAADLARRGPEWFPTNKRIRQLASVFAPPRVLGTAPARPHLKASRRWLAQHSTEYRGMWVAVYDGKLIATAKTRAGLTPQLPAHVSRTEILITRVLNA